MTPNELQQLLCGGLLLIVTLTFLIVGFKWLHGPDYRRDTPPDDAP